jgi:hypothetical protein
MRRFRFHISSLLSLVLLLGVGFAGLREANDFWDSGVFSLAIGVLLVSTLLAIHRTEKRRAFWVGFALFGWSYLSLISISSIEPRLLTTKALAYLDSRLANRPLVITGQYWGSTGQAWGSSPNNQNPNLPAMISPQGNFVAGGNSATLTVTVLPGGSGKLFGVWGGTTENFLRIGHSLLALITAWLGGNVSRYLYRTSRATAPALDGS